MVDNTLVRISSFIPRGLLMLAVIAATGPWCCCTVQAAARADRGAHSCCTKDQKSAPTPAQPKHDSGCLRCVTAMTDAGKCEVAPLAAPTYTLSLAFDFAPAGLMVASATFAPPLIAYQLAPPAPSLHAQGCLLTI